MIDANYFLLLDNAARARERVLEHPKGTEAQKKKAMAELARLEACRPLFGFLTAVAIPSMPREQELRSLRSQRPAPEWPADHAKMIEQALLLAAEIAPITGRDGIHGVLRESAHANGPLWGLAMKNHAALRALGIDLAALSINESAAERVLKELAVLGLEGAAVHPQAKQAEAMRLQAGDAPLLKGAWDAACFEAKMPEDRMVGFSEESRRGFGFPAHLMIPRMRSHGSRGAQQNPRSLDDGEWDESDVDADVEQEQAAEFEEAVAAAREKRKLDNLNPSERAKRLALMADEAAWLEKETQRRTIVQRDQQTAARAMAMTMGPERVLLLAAGRSRGLHFSSHAVAAQKSIGEVFEAVAKVADAHLTPAVATACAAGLSDKAPLALGALKLCREKGAKFAHETGEKTAWGVEWERQIESWAMERVQAPLKKTQDALDRVIGLVAKWAQEDGVEPPSGSWSVHWAAKAAGALSGKQDEDDDGYMIRGEERSALISAWTFLSEQQSGLKESVSQKDAKAFAGDMIEAKLQWAEDTAHDQEVVKTGAGRLKKSARGQTVDTERAAWDKIDAQASRLKAMAVGPAPAKRGPRTL